MSTFDELMAKFKSHGRVVVALVLAVAVGMGLLNFLPALPLGGRLAAVGIPLGLLLAIAWWSEQARARLGQALAREVDSATTQATEARTEARKLQEICSQLETARTEFEEQARIRFRQAEARATEADTRAAAVAGEMAGLQSQMDEMGGQKQSLQLELRETAARRAALETRNLDLEERLRDFSEQTGEESVRLKTAERELKRVLESEAVLRAEGDTYRSHALELRRELDALTAEHANSRFRESQIAQKLQRLEGRATGAEELAQAAQMKLADDEPQETLRRELHRLQAGEKAWQRESQALRERGGLLETELTAAQDELRTQTAKAAEAQALVDELHQNLRSARAEPKLQMAEHFVWKVNYFHSKEVTLNFINKGLDMDVIAVETEPRVAAELPGARFLPRGAEMRVKFATGTDANLPQEFVVRLVYSVIRQEARFRLQPFEANKIERL